MKTSSFDYPLPQELIAQSPVLPREACRLLVLHRSNGAIEHRVFEGILEYLDEGDLLVVNDTKVMPARLLGVKQPSNMPVEVLLLRRIKELDAKDDEQAEHWEALVKPGRRLKPGSSISFGGLEAKIVDWVQVNGKGKRIVKLVNTGGYPNVSDAIQAEGILPLPPYIKDYTQDTSLYQTVYAQEQNSAAAPTAGLHFSEDLLSRAEAKGCRIAPVSLEIGLDTFRKVEEENINDHQIHSEVYSLNKTTVQEVQRAKERGGRVIAVGTTAVRALESAALPLKSTKIGTEAEGNNEGSANGALLRTIAREQTRLYITPGFEFKVVDALITNFHTPRSTLLMLVSAFAGHEAIFEAYRQAIDERYRFLSFGDAMLIL